MAERLVTLCVALLMAGGCAPSSDDAADPSMTVRLAYVRIGTDLPYFVGQAEGIFEKHGLAVTGVRLGDSNQTVAALLNGDVDATDMAGSSVVYAQALEHPDAFRVYMASAAGPESNVHQLIARRGAGVASIADLDGRRLAGFPGSQMRTYVELVLARHLGGPDGAARVELVPLTPPQQIQAMRDGRVDAVLAIEPAGTMLVVDGVGDRIASNVLYEEVSKPEPFVTAYGLYGTAWAEANPAARAALVEAYREIASVIATRPEVVRRVLEADLGVDEAVAARASVYDYAVVPDLDESAVRASIDLLVRSGDLRAPIPVERLLGGR